jgi:anti-sigma factor (TIGR02949 family)
MGEPIGCRQAVQQLWEYLDQELEEIDRQAVDAHLAFCRRCCGELAFAKELRSLLRTTGDPDLPTQIDDRLQGFIDDLDGPTETGAPT